MNDAFKIGFIKRALEEGYSKEEAQTLFETKLAEGHGDYYQDVKDVLRTQGANPQYNVDDTHPAALGYNNALLQARDQFGTKDPNLEGAKAGLGSAAIGGVVGAGAGELSGHVAGKFVNPKYVNLIKRLPGWGKALGIAAGATGAGLPAFEKARHRVETMHKLNDPRIMQAMLDQLSRERQLTNNQLGSYRPIGIEPQGY